MTKKLLCAVAFNVHDSSVAFAFDEKIVLVLEAERVFRIKKKSCNLSEMEHLIKEGLKCLGKKPEDIAHLSMTTLNNPLLTRDDIVDPDSQNPREPYYKDITILGLKHKALVVNHHLAHAATYLLSNFQHAVITTCDGGGDYDPRKGFGETLAAFRADENLIERKSVKVTNPVTGKTYASGSKFIYGAERSAGKLMALAALGQVDQEYLKIFESIGPKIESADYPDAADILEKSFPNLKGSAAGNNPTAQARNFCATLQHFFMRMRLENTKEIVAQLYKPGDSLVIAGGTGLNLDLNTSVLGQFPHMQHYIAPCCDDTGQALGAISLLITQALNVRPQASLPYMGMGPEKYEYDSAAINKIVDVLLNDGVLVLHNGQAEIGPRALGNRSLIARPDSLAVKKHLSEDIKQREAYRPVAPIVLAEKIHDYFIGPESSPFMLYKYGVIESAKNKIIGAVHLDGSARAQTVSRENNPFLYNLLKEFGRRTGTYVLLNTSLNLQGEPIANYLGDSQNIYGKITGPKIFVYNGQIQN